VTLRVVPVHFIPMNARSLFVAMGISSLRNGVKLILVVCLDGVKPIGTTLHGLRVVPVHFIPIFHIRPFRAPDHDENTD
jgi:hypothetical protein